jgi:hypothetical protein
MITPKTHITPRFALLPGAALGLALAVGTSLGCDGDLLGVKAPQASLDRVDLLESPSANKLARWGCHQYLDSSTCNALGIDKPKKSNMRFSIDAVFDLNNPNKNIAIPLIEMLLAMTVYPAETNQSLGAVCVSFCDPGESTCTPDADAEAACDLSSATQVDTISDLVPTVDEMFEIAEEVAEGDTTSNNEFRYIPKGGSTEAHIQIDLDIDAMLVVLEKAVEDAANDLFNGRNIRVKVPHSSEGNVFFNVPKAGRYAVGFGPFDDQWDL